MRRDNEVRLETAIHALKADEPDASQMAAASRRLADRLGVIPMEGPAVDVIRSCDDVRQLFISYHAGATTKKRSLVIEAHLRDCCACRNLYQTGAATNVVDWFTPKPERANWWRPQAMAWGLAACLAMLTISLFVYRAYWQVPPGVRAEVQSINGPAYLITNSGDDRLVSPGDALNEGDLLRTGGDAHAFVKLSDGSTVEVNQRSEFGVSARGRNMTISLDNGAVIVQAAKRTSGNLFVTTPDCRVAVTGTVFSVSSGIKGSRVAVVEGMVHVLHAGVESVVHAGDQVATTDNLSPVPVEQQIGWSADRDKYLVLLAQFAGLRNRLDQIPFPEPRYTSDLLQRVPLDTLFYVSIPNLGEFLNQANGIFHDQLQTSPALQQWWSHGSERSTAELDSLVEKIHGMSQYLGNEVVIVAESSLAKPEAAIIADVTRTGLADFLKTQLTNVDSSHSLVVVGQDDLSSLAMDPRPDREEFALVREHEVVFSNSIPTLKRINAQLNAGASGFDKGAFGRQIAAAYGRGAGIILAADLHDIMGANFIHFHDAHAARVVEDNSGLSDMRYLIAEHRETNGQPENHLNLQFAAARRGVASWLAAPASIGSLDFVTPNAAFAVAFLSKDPKAIVDDILNMATATSEMAAKDFNKTEDKLGINLRDDLAANLGGDASISLDGPVLPTPSWKAVVEVHDPEQLEKTLEQLTQAIRNQPEAKGHGVSIDWKDSGSQRYYTVRDLATDAEVMDYTFADGYMIVGPNRAILMEALHAHTVGDSLARSASFKALLPKDENENYSAIAYQNLSPVLNPLLSQVKGDAAAAVQELAADARPTVVCAWGQENRIEVSSNSRLFGFDFLTLGSLLNGTRKTHKT
jgi:hypothetical protein